MKKILLALFLTGTLWAPRVPPIIMVPAPPLAIENIICGLIILNIVAYTNLHLGPNKFIFHATSDREIFYRLFEILFIGYDLSSLKIPVPDPNGEDTSCLTKTLLTLIEINKHRSLHALDKDTTSRCTLCKETSHWDIAEHKPLDEKAAQAVQNALLELNEQKNIAKNINTIRKNLPKNIDLAFPLIRLSTHDNSTSIAQLYAQASTYKKMELKEPAHEKKQEHLSVPLF